VTLSPKNQRFEDECTIDQNAAQAYKRDGYKPANDRAAKSAGSRLCQNVDVRAAIDAWLDILAPKRA
jgi:phage terminase small subunit